MPKWYVEVYVGQDVLHIGEPFVRKDDQTILAFLATCLQDPAMTIVADEAYHFWVSTDFDALATENEVYQLAQSNLPILNGIMQIRFGRDIVPIKIGDVYHLDSNGYLARTVMRSTLRSEGIFLPENILQSANAQKPSIVDILVIAKNSPHVQEALQQLATSHSWYSLVKVFEIIADYAGQAENSGKLPRGTFDIWTQGRDFGKNPPGNLLTFCRPHIASTGSA